MEFRSQKIWPAPIQIIQLSRLKLLGGGGWGGGGGSEGYVCVCMHARACVCVSVCSTIDHSADRQDNSSLCFHQICLLISKLTLPALFTTINQCA